MVPLSYVDEVYCDKLMKLEKERQLAKKTIKMMQKKVDQAIQAEENEKTKAQILKDQNNDLKLNFHRTLIEKLNNGKLARAGTFGTCEAGDEIIEPNDGILMT